MSRKGNNKHMKGYLTSRRIVLSVQKSTLDLTVGAISILYLDWEKGFGGSHCTAS